MALECKTCGEEIPVPKDWSPGPAIRRHYWEKHRDIMLPNKSPQLIHEEVHDADDQGPS